LQEQKFFFAFGQVPQGGTRDKISKSQEIISAEGGMSSKIKKREARRKINGRRFAPPHEV
jgi:hypothetical protein